MDSDAPHDTFQFFAKSADRLPGKGVGEYVADASVYQKLSEVRHWRRRFSDMWEEELSIMGKRYRTHHHALQAGKFLSAGLSEIADKFSLDSGDKIGQGSTIDARRARKIVRLTEGQLSAWRSASGEWKDLIYKTKFAPGTECAKVLLLTGNAEMINTPEENE